MPIAGPGDYRPGMGAAAPGAAARAAPKETAAAAVKSRDLVGRLAALEVAKRQAVERQDFDRAKLIKQEAEYLRREMEARESILSNPRGTSRGVARN